MKKLPLSSGACRKLWWIALNGDTGCIFRGPIVRSLQRGYLQQPLTEEERILAVRLAESEQERLRGKVDDSSRSVDELLTFLNGGSNGKT